MCMERYLINDIDRIIYNGAQKKVIQTSNSYIGDMHCRFIYTLKKFD